MNHAESDRLRSRCTATRRRPVADRVADLLGRMTIDEKVGPARQRVGVPARGGDRLSTPSGARRCSQHGLGQVTRVSGASSVAAADAAARRQRDPAAPGRADPAGHSGHHPRGDLRRADGARAPPCSRRRSASPARSDPSSIERMADASCAPQMRAIGRPPGPVARARHLPRSALGPDRGDVRRGSAPRRDDGHRVRRAACRATTLGDGVVATAKHFVGYGASRGRAQLGAGPHSRPASCARSTCARSRRPCATAGLPSVMNAYHELDGIPCGADRWLLTEHAARRVGLRRLRGLRLLRGRQLDDYHHLAGRRHRGGVDGVDRRASTSSSRCTDCYGDAVGRRRRRRNRQRRDPRPRRRAGAADRSSSSDCSSAPSSTSPARRRSSAPPPVASSLASLADQSLVLLRNDGTLPIAPDDAGDDRRDRSERRRPTQPVRRLQLRRPRRVADRGARRRQRVPRSRSPTTSTSTSTSSATRTVLRARSRPPSRRRPSARRLAARSTATDRAASPRRSGWPPNPTSP